MKRIILSLMMVILFAGIASAERPAIPKACKFDDGVDAMQDCKATVGSIAANTNWFPENIGRERSNEAYRHRFEINCPITTVVKMIVTNADKDVTHKTYYVNSGNALIGGRGYSLSKTIQRNQVYNFQHETATQGCSIEINEIQDIKN